MLTTGVTTTDLDRRTTTVACVIELSNTAGDFIGGVNFLIQLPNIGTLAANGSYAGGSNNGPMTFSFSDIQGNTVSSTVKMACNRLVIIGVFDNANGNVRMYVNGTKTQSNQSPGFGNLTSAVSLGLDVVNHMWGYGFEYAIYNKSLTDTEAADLTTYLATSNGVVLSPTINAIVQGDSITFGDGTAPDTWCKYTPLLNMNRYFSFAQAGTQLGNDGITGAEPIWSCFDSTITYNVFLPFKGTNDVFTGTKTGAQLFTILKNYCNFARTKAAAAGVSNLIVVVATMLYRGASANGGYNGQADAFNALVMADTSGAWDGVIALHLLPYFANPDGFKFFTGADGVHPNQAGWQVIGAEANRVLQQQITKLGYTDPGVSNVKKNVSYSFAGATKTGSATGGGFHVGGGARF